MMPMSLPLHINLNLIPLSSDQLTVTPFVACYPYQVLPPAKEQSAWLTQKLQASGPSLLNCLIINSLVA
jgi:hypothetical protein